jgi:hypothetical protein
MSRNNLLLTDLFDAGQQDKRKGNGRVASLYEPQHSVAAVVPLEPIESVVAEITSFVPIAPTAIAGAGSGKGQGGGGPGGSGGHGGGKGGGGPDGSGHGGGSGSDHTEGASNNLSFPAIWLQGQGDDPLGLDSRSSENSLSLTVPFAAEPDADGYYYFAQKTEGNTWQAGNMQALAPVEVDWVDIGDAMESAPVGLGRFLRLELALYDALDTPMRAYTMTQLSEQTGRNEVQGVQALQPSVTITENSAAIDALTGTTYQSNFATVYAPMMELTIQKFATEAPSADQLTGLRWNGEQSIWVGDGIGTVDYAADIQFGSELNIAGKVINGVSDKPFRYTDAGLYRVTFSLPDGIPVLLGASTQVGTYDPDIHDFAPVTEGRTTLVVPDGQLGVGGVDTHNGLLYMDMIVPSPVGGEGEDELAQLVAPSSLL